MKSNFALFFEEYENMYTLEKDVGFVTYKFIDDINACYMVNAFVNKKYRNNNVVYRLLDEVVEIAKKSGYNLLISSTDPDSNTPDRSKRVLKKYGFKYKKHSDNLDWYAKEI